VHGQSHQIGGVETGKSEVWHRNNWQ
jgi:hypothetical protein